MTASFGFLVVRGYLKNANVSSCRKKKEQKPASPVTLDLPNFSDNKIPANFIDGCVRPVSPVGSAHDGLAEAGVREVAGRLHSRSDAVGAIALSNTVLPHGLVVAVVARVSLVVTVVVVVVRGLLVATIPLGISGRLREPLVVSGVGRRGRVDVLGCAVARVGRGERCRLPVPVVGLLVGNLVALDGFVALVFSCLLLNEVVVSGATAVSVDAGVDGRDKSLAGGASCGLVLENLPLVPAGEPSLVVLAVVQVDVETPARLL